MRVWKVAFYARYRNLNLPFAAKCGVHFRIGTTEKNGQNTTNIFRLLLRIISVNMCVRKCILATIQPKNKLRSPTPGMTYRSLHLFPILTGRDEDPTAAAILGDNSGTYACC